MEDLEIGLPSYYQTRPSNKKMKTRKQLDALHKSRMSTSKTSIHAARQSSADILGSSEDELFLPDRTLSPKKSSVSSENMHNNMCDDGTFILDTHRPIVVGVIILVMSSHFVSFVYL
jgi:hypothetical protein